MKNEHQRKSSLINLPLVSLRLKKLGQLFRARSDYPNVSNYTNIIKSHPAAFSGRQLNTSCHSNIFPNKQVIPNGIQGIPDEDLRNLLYLCFGLLEQNITMIEIQSIRTLQQMDYFLSERKILLLDIISSGKLPSEILIPESIKLEFYRRAQSTKQRRRELIECFYKEDPKIVCIWPDLEVVTIHEDDIENAGHLKRIVPVNCSIYNLPERDTNTDVVQAYES